MSRSATRNRATKETSIDLSIELDGSGTATVSTGIPFYDHMLEQLGKHGGLTPTTPWRTSASHSAPHSGRRSVIGRGSPATVTPTRRLTRRWREWWWIALVARSFTSTG